MTVVRIQGVLLNLLKTCNLPVLYITHRLWHLDCRNLFMIFMLIMMMNAAKVPLIQDFEEPILIFLHVKLCEKKAPKGPSSSTS